MIFEQWWEAIQPALQSNTLNFWQTIYKEIYLNVIKEGRWLNYLQGLGKTLEVSFFAILVVPITAAMEMGGYTATVTAIDNGRHSRDHLYRCEGHGLTERRYRQIEIGHFILRMIHTGRFAGKIYAGGSRKTIRFKILGEVGFSQTLAQFHQSRIAGIHHRLGQGFVTVTVGLGTFDLSFADQMKALEGADFVYAKNWSCPGVTNPADYGKILSKDMGWVVDERHMAVTNNAYFMHCLPVRRNMIVSDGVIDSPRSIVIPEAANRVVSAQVVMKRMLEGLK